MKKFEKFNLERNPNLHLKYGKEKNLVEEISMTSTDKKRLPRQIKRRQACTKDTQGLGSKNIQTEISSNTSSTSSKWLVSPAHCNSASSSLWPTAKNREI